MKASEFRIGNSIRVVQNDGYFTCKIVSVEELGCRTNLKNENKFIFYTEIEAILLTKEELLKFKWFEIKDGQFIFEDNNYLSINEDGCLYVENNYTANEDISFVHQLQNLYFGLTGEELKPIK